MNAPPAFRAPKWQDFRSTVLPIFPRASDEELETRARLLLIRDMALQALGWANEEAYHLLRAVSEMAGKYALADMTLDQLVELRRILVLTTANASAMQVLMNSIYYPSMEGTDARGQ